MSTLNVEEMLLLMEGYIDEESSAYYGGSNQAGRLTTSRWLREAYNNLWGKLVDADKHGEWVGEEVTANYTGGATSVAMTAWSTRGAPLRIYDVRSGSNRLSYVPLLDIDELSLNIVDSASYLWTRFGNNLRLLPVPSAAVSLTLRFAPPPVKLYYETVGAGPPVVPAPPGGGVWLAYTPSFVPGYYEAIPAYAAVLAKQCENNPEAPQTRHAAMLEADLLAFVRSHSTQRQAQPGVRISNRHDYKGYRR